MRLLTFLVSFTALLLISCSSNDPETYNLTVTAVPEEAGTVTPENGEFEEGREIEIAATSTEGWRFDRWQGDVESENNPTVLTMDSDKDIAALFVKREYPLTIETIGEGEVSERVVTEKTTDYESGTRVELTAEPAEGWTFTRWEGDLESTENPEIVTIESPTEITALFSRIEYPLTVNIVGNGTVDEEVIASKVTDYESGTEVQLTAIPDEEYLFSDWTGDLESDENPATITIDGPKTVTATFLRTFKFTTIVNPEGAGTITPDSGRYVRDVSFEVEAVPEPGWEFTNWEGDFTGSVNPFDLTMNGNKTLVANFERKAFVLTTDVTGNGQVLTNLISGSEDEDGFLFESEIELTAVPAENWNFVRWEGDIESTENPITVSMDQDISLVAVFSIFDGGDGSAENPYQLSSVLQLQEIQNHLDAHFIQTADIDAVATATWNNNEGFEPIGDDVDFFTGSYDGGGFEIGGLTINRPEEFNVGLFGYINGGSVSNVSLVAADISGEERVGGIVGINEGLIDSVSVEGSIMAESIAGGVAGRNIGPIQNAHASVEISGSGTIGGLVGINSSIITKSYSSVTVENVLSVGGGFVGRNSGRIDESYAEGSVEGTENIGGFIGVNNPGGIITNSYSLADVTGDDVVGGFIGDNNTATEVEFSYSSGVVAGLTNTGGFIGTHSNQSTLLNGNYWDAESSGLADGVGDGSSDGTTGLQTAEMSGEEAEVNMTAFNWDTIWITSAANYPVLRWQVVE
jgi:hypothetical protein